MEGMNPRGFFYQCLIHLSSAIPPCTTLFICFHYEYLVQCSMITTHHSCTSIFPIYKLQFITFPQNLHTFKRIVILVNDNLQDTNKLLCLSLLFNTYHDQCLFVSSFLFLLVKNCQNTTRFSKKGIFCHKFSFKKICQIAPENCFLRSMSLHSCPLATYSRVL
jgi:hypothetical protein